MELACGYRPKNEIKVKRMKGETMGLNLDSSHNTLLVIKLPSSQALRVVSRSLFLAMLIIALPCIGSFLRGIPSSLNDPEAIGSHSIGSDFLPLLFHDLSAEGLVKKGDRVLILSSGGGNFMDCSEFLNENGIDLAIESDLAMKGSMPDETFDFVLSLSANDNKVVDRVLKIGGLLVMQVSNDPSNPFQQHANYKIVYLRRFDSIVVAMRKAGLADEFVKFPRKIRQCGDMVEAKKLALKSLEDVFLEPPPRRALARQIKFLPDLLGDSLQSYRQRIFITDDNGGVVQWFYKNYPTRNQYFEVYNLEVGIYDEEKGDKLLSLSRSTSTNKVIGVSDWLSKNVREEDFVVMKAEAQVVEEMVREKTICLVDELFLECKYQWQGDGEENEGKRAYWECLALYGRLRDEGVAVHQWWG